MAETCVQGRGVMIDLHAHFGREHRHVGYEDLRRVMDTDGVSVEPGDMVCLHTGFAQMLVEMDGRPDAHALEHSCAVLDGRDQRLLDWIASYLAPVLVGTEIGHIRRRRLGDRIGQGHRIENRCATDRRADDLCRK